MIEPLIAYGILAVALIAVFAIYMATSKKSGSAAETAESEPEPIIIIEESNENEDENELIAVISAAVTAYLNSLDECEEAVFEISAPPTKFRVVSFRKVK